MKNQEITKLSNEIMVELTNAQYPLNTVLLKCSRLALLLNLPQKTKLFLDWSEYVEQHKISLDSVKVSLEAARDPNISISSANPNQSVWNPHGNFREREIILKNAKFISKEFGKTRSEAYKFALEIYTKWNFGNKAESIFEKKRAKTDSVLREIFPDSEQRLNAIEQSLNSDNPEHWKNAVISCRTLMMDLADNLNPAKDSSDKNKYLNRLKDFVSPKHAGKTKKKYLDNLLEELKLRIEHVWDQSQGPAHQDRPIKEQAENIVLYTYLLVADLMEIYTQKQNIE